MERLAFQNLPDIVKLELSNNPQLSYIHPQAFRCLTLCLCCGTLRILFQFRFFSRPLSASAQIPAVSTDAPPPQ